jgi:hypothetical protein
MPTVMRSQWCHKYDVQPQGTVMKHHANARSVRRFLPALLLCAGSVAAMPQQSDHASALRAKYASLQSRLRENQFNRPLVLESTEGSRRLQGDAYALVDYPFAVVNPNLGNPDHWCDILLLHVNTKYCHAMNAGSGTTLQVDIGKKTQEALADASRIDFSYRVAQSTPDYLDVALTAADGPMGTSDYRISLEAVALPHNQTFLHLRYAYRVSLAGRLAMQTYMGTVGYDKVGFSMRADGADGRSGHIGGVRGLMERNTMRYYLAIDSFLGATGTAPDAQPEKRLRDWFAATERYARQLHEMDLETYLVMKRAERMRQQALR